MQHFAHLPIETQLPYFTRLHHLLSTSQGGNVFFLPHSGLTYRVAQFHAWIKRQHRLDIKLVDLNLPSNNPHSLETKLHSITSPLMIVAHRQFLGPDRVAYGEILQSIYTTSNQPILIFHECAPSELNSSSLPSLLYQNHFLYPLPQLDDLPSYLVNLSRDWKIKLSSGQVNEITTLCGNQLWLINEYLRQLSSHPTITSSQVSNTQVFVEKSQLIWQMLPDPYQRTITEPSSHPSAITLELASFNLVDQHTQLYGTWSTKLVQTAQSVNLEVNPHTLVYRGRDLTLYFTAKERSLLASLTRQTSHLSREQVAQLIWGQEWETLYSDWALDQTMRRLRQKIQNLQLPILINTKRGVGYVYARLPGI